MDLFTRLVDLEQSFKYDTPAENENAWFRTLRGDLPVLVSAPHACKHERDGVIKMQEEYTGAIALYLHEVCGCHAIVTTCRTSEDPNWQESSCYKRAIKSMVQRYNIGFVIDLHGMTNRYHMGVAIGTIHGQSCVSKPIVHSFVTAGFKFCDNSRLWKPPPNVTTIETSENSGDTALSTSWCEVVVDHPKFTGGLVSPTVTRFVSRQLGVNAVQIELASSARVVYSAATDDWPYDYRGVPEAVSASVTALQSLIERNVCLR